jgi:protein-tyrosine phosphatase
MPDLHWLTDSLAVGGCFPPEQAGALATEHGISAVVDLRGEACDDETALGNAGIALLHLPTPDLEAASVAMLERGVGFVRGQVKGGGKVLIHCQHGIGRSALLALCVLVDEGWEPLDALAHAKDRRERISPSELQYRGWARWLDRRGIAAPDYHSFGCIAYRHLARG